MSFETNRDTLLDSMGIKGGQILEHQVAIQSFVTIDRAGMQTEIFATSSNMFGRYVVQFLAELISPGGRPTEIEMTLERRALISLVFAVRWVGRGPLIAVGETVRIEGIVWKES